jgi:hypothetical protein
MTAADQFDENVPVNAASPPAGERIEGEFVSLGRAELSPLTRAALWVLRIAALILTGMVIAIFIAQLEAH